MERQLTIQFSEEEIEIMRAYFMKVHVDSMQDDHPLTDANTVFLLLRKLLAYGVLNAIPTDSELNYQDLQKQTQKFERMQAYVREHTDLFEKLVAAYLAQYS